MSRVLGRLATVAIVAVVAGCGLGPGESSEGTAKLTVTRDYGSTPMVEGSVDDPDESETVLRLLDREADIETRYGGGFVQSIDGVSGAVDSGRSLDWFFYVNGIESPIGSADRPVAGGDRVWWDHHDWTDVMRVPAVVGSWPEPFLQASANEERLPVRVECAAARAVCKEALERLTDEGVSAGLIEFGRSPADEARARARTLSVARATESVQAPVLRMLVGRWRALRSDPGVAQIAEGPARSGVFARFARGTRGPELIALDERAEPAARLGAGAGIVAAVRDGERPPTWVVSGVDRAGVSAAAKALDPALLEGRYAVAVGAGSDSALALPVVGAP